MQKKGSMRVFDSKEELALYFGELLYEKSKNSNRLTLALSGGSTPKAIFDTLAANFKDLIDWNKIHWFWGDERCVPPTDEESNYKMTLDHLLSQVDIPNENIHRIKGELSVKDASCLYSEELTKLLPVVDGVPQFDIVLLGMGTDGHTASIFPYQISLWDAEDLCVPAQHPESGQDRVSLSGKVINHAREIYFLVTGKDKAVKVDEILNHKGAYKTYPASLVANAVWLMDKEASGI